MTSPTLRAMLPDDQPPTMRPSRPSSVPPSDTGVRASSRSDLGDLEPLEDDLAFEDTLTAPMIFRPVRIEQKVARARARLEAIGAVAGDARDSLLRIAVLRGDETLVDGVLASLGGA